jgi:hypothetical protein
VEAEGWSVPAGQTTHLLPTGSWHSNPEPTRVQDTGFRGSGDYIPIST